MRRATLLLLAMIAAVLLATGVAVALTKTCSTNPCKGTDQDDVLLGTGGINDIRGLAGADAIFAKADNDIIYGGPGNDNFETQAKDDPNGIGNVPDLPFGAGLNGGTGNDTIYGDDKNQAEPGDDDLVGNAGNDTLDDRNQKGDWDRAFGGTGDDKVYFDDGDIEDEISCGENATSTTDGLGDQDTAYIDVLRAGRYPAKIDYADTVHEKDSKGNAVNCETIYAKDQYGEVRPVTKDDPLPSDDATVAAVEPVA
jgi:Ca2+-binding RTX toxin-like protein